MSDPKIITKEEREFRKRSRLGLGDVVSKVATPIASTLKMSCIDETTKQLKPDSPCARRKKSLNEFSDKILGLLKPDNQN